MRNKSGKGDSNPKTTYIGWLRYDNVGNIRHWTRNLLIMRIKQDKQTKEKFCGAFFREKYG